MNRLLTAHSIIWAALVLATAIVLSANEAGHVFIYLLTIVHVPLWFASDRLMRKAIRFSNGH